MTKTFESLIPSIEARESGWMRIRERLAHPHQVPSHPPSPSPGSPVVKGIPGPAPEGAFGEASGQPWTLFDKALVDKVASDESPIFRHFWAIWGMKAMPRMSSGPTSATSPTMTPTPSW